MKALTSLLFSLALIAQDDAQELLRQGALLNQRAQFDKAAPILERAVKAAPGSAAARMELAVCLARLHRYKQASEVLKPVSPPEAVPQLLLYHRLKASIASGNEEHAAAAAEMELALDLAPADKDLLLATAVAEFRASLFDKALAHAQSAKSIQYSAAIENLIGDIQEKRGDSLAAVHSYQTAVELAPDNEQFRLALALELLRHHTSDPAIQVLEQAAKRFPSSLKLNVALALGYFLVNRDADATKALLQAMRLELGRDFVLQYLSELLITQGDTPDPAIVTEVCADADAHPMSGRGQAVCGGLLLRAQIDRGDTSRHAELLQRLRKAVQLAPKDDTARCQLGKALALDQHWLEARKQMEECARLVPGSTEWHYQLARIYLRLGLRDLAKEQERLRSEADKKLAAESQRRYATVSKFIYALDKTEPRP